MILVDLNLLLYAVNRDAPRHGAELCSSDNDFDRFAHLRWTNPLV